MRLGIISALPEEQAGLIEAMYRPVRHVHAGREVFAGLLWEIDAVCVLSRIGKVAAAMTATLLVEKFKVTHILFTGVAGAGQEGGRVGDIVVADTLIQHDMDASPLFPRHQVPMTGCTGFSTDDGLATLLREAAATFLHTAFAQHIDEPTRQAFKLAQPRLHGGLIASGDQFIHQASQLQALQQALPALMAVEMEGAAVAQVCHELGVPFAVIRTISDNANENAALDFLHFVQAVAARYAFGITRLFCERLRALPQPR